MHNAWKMREGQVVPQNTWHKSNLGGISFQVILESTPVIFCESFSAHSSFLMDLTSHNFGDAYYAYQLIPYPVPIESIDHSDYSTNHMKSPWAYGCFHKSSIPKMMIYNGKSYLNDSKWMIWGIPISGNLHMKSYETIWNHDIISMNLRSFEYLDLSIPVA